MRDCVERPPTIWILPSFCRQGEADICLDKREDCVRLNLTRGSGRRMGK